MVDALLVFLKTITFQSIELFLLQLAIFIVFSYHLLHWLKDMLKRKDHH